MAQTKVKAGMFDGSFGTDWDSNIKTENFTAISGKGYLLNTTSAAITITLPSNPSIGDEIVIVDYSSSAGTNNIIINPGSLNIKGTNNNLILNTDEQTARLVYSSVGRGWLLVAESLGNSAPTITSISYSGSNTATDTAGGETITILGTNFIPSSTVTIGNTIASSVTYISTVELRFTAPALSAGDYNVTVEGNGGLVTTSINGISYNGVPSWTTASGSIASLLRTNTGSVTLSVSASEPDGGAIAYSLTSGSLPNGFSLNTSTGDITGNMYNPGVTTFNFTITATDNEAQSTPRAFSISFRDLISEIITTTGAWAVPVGITSVQVELAAGGGGGGGGGSGGGCGYATGGSGGSGGNGAGNSYRGGNGSTGGNYTGADGGNGGGAVWGTAQSISVTPGQSINVTIGAGGAGGVGGYYRGGYTGGSFGGRAGSPGSAGGHTSFGNLSTSGTNGTVNQTGNAGTGETNYETGAVNDQTFNDIYKNGHTGGNGADGAVRLTY